MDNLRKIGVVVHQTDVDNAGQVRVTLAPHVGGSVDGIIEQGLPEAPTVRHIAEFKTHSRKSFEELVKKGVFDAHRRHWCQMQCYMLGTGIDWAFYMAVCKDDDRLYTERVPFQKETAEMIVKRGARIALAERMPDPLSHNASWYQCKMCPFWTFCHDTHLTRELNCRTCSHVTPTAEGAWRCEFFRSSLSYEAQLAGCASHVFHPDLTPWVFLGGDDTGRCGLFEIDGKRLYNGSAEYALTSKQLLEGVRAVPENQGGCPF